MPTKRNLLTSTLRARICELHDIGWSYRRIQQRHPEVSVGAIAYTVKTQNLRNDQETRPHSGRPQRLSPDEEARIIEMRRQNPEISLRKLQAAMPGKPGISTIRRLLLREKMCPAGPNKQTDRTEQNEQRPDTGPTQQMPATDERGGAIQQ